MTARLPLPDSIERERPPLVFSDLWGHPERQVMPGLLGPEFPSIAQDYRPWRKVRHAAKQAGIEPERAWAAIKGARVMNWRYLELMQTNGQPFGICLGPHLLAPLHHIDRATGGGGPVAIDAERGILSDDAARSRFRIQTMMDEAAESSIIEGAVTTRKEAVELLRSGRTPRSRSEQMVINNYVGMQQIKQWLHRPLSVEMLLELQSIMTDRTLDDQAAAGRLRTPGENVRIVDTRDESVVFVPPPAETLSDRLKRLCAFANSDHDGGNFLHPVIKACLLHFMIGYEHPFIDGNGRTARAVFYWYTLRNGYSVFEYTVISELIRKGYAQYPQAFLDTELDDGDLTYFVLYKLNIIERALDRLADHLRRQEEKIKFSERLLKLSRDLNLRQRLLLEHALRHPGTKYTVKSHMNSNGIVAATARADLDGLTRKRLFTSTTRGREVIYHPAPGLADRLAKKGL